MKYIVAHIRSVASVTAVIGFLAMPAFAFASASVSIQALSPGANVTVGQGISFIVAGTGFVNPTYAVSDSFSDSTVSSTDINSSSGAFNWTPANSDIGTHNLTIMVSDSQGDTASAEESITVSAPASISLQALSPGSTMIAGQTLSFYADVTGFTNPSYSLGDSFSGSTLSNSDINSSGNFSWTPSSSQDGTHTITVYATDALGHSAQASETVTVESTPTLVIGTLSPGTTIAPGQDLTFTTTASNVSSPTYSVNDSYNGTSLRNSDINSSGAFSWMPGLSDYGTHIITVFVMDGSSGLSAMASQSITVSGTPVASDSATVQDLSPSSTVIVGQTVTFAVVTSGFTDPVFSTGDSFHGDSSITNSDISSAGNFSWTPGDSDLGVHNVTIYITDSSGHSANVAVSIPVVQTAVAITPTATITSVTTGSQSAATGATATGVTSNVVFTENMSIGMSDDQVMQLQKLLLSKGYLSATATGYYGALTEAAVIKFQAANGIQQVGTVGPQTRAALNALSTSQSSPVSTPSTPPASASAGLPAQAGDGYVFTTYISYGDSSTAVTELQKRLTALGIYSGPVTGYFGALTEAAVKTFQSDHGLEQVGYAGPATRAALNQ